MQYLTINVSKSLRTIKKNYVPPLVDGVVLAKMQKPILFSLQLIETHTQTYANGNHDRTAQSITFKSIQIHYLLEPFSELLFTFY